MTAARRTRHAPHHEPSEDPGRHGSLLKNAKFAHFFISNEAPGRSHEDSQPELKGSGQNPYGELESSQYMGNSKGVTYFCRNHCLSRRGDPLGGDRRRPSSTYNLSYKSEQITCTSQS